MKRKGFAYIIAVLILGLLAFMGLFLMQSSSVEYSQAAISCYATMAQQLAEAATDEAFVLIEELLRDGADTGKKGPLLRQCAVSDFPGVGDSGTNPKLLDVLPDFKSYVSQTDQLVKYHLSRAGFEIEQVKPRITDCRPIDYRPYMLPQCQYRPKDRGDPFETKPNGKISRDYYLSLSFDVIVALKMGTKRHKYMLQTTRDMKIVNVGPIARNYTLFSMLGVEFSSDATKTQQEVTQDLSLGTGRLVLWNHPYQSRVYLHGPAVIGIENPDVLTPEDLQGNYQGAFMVKSTDGRPGVNHAFQYSDTCAGLSYLPAARAFWENPNWSGYPDKGDTEYSAEEKDKMFQNATKIKGSVPRLQNLSWLEIQNWLQLGEDYVRGTVRRQVFLPAGPFCRFPWKFVPERRPANYSPNQVGDQWPKNTPDLRIEHRDLVEDPEFDKNTKIYSFIKRFKIWKAGTLADTYRAGGYPQALYPEFSLNYCNPKDGLLAILGNILTSCWNTITTPVRMVFIGGQAVWRMIFSASDPNSPNAQSDRDIRNFFPTNFKIFPRAASIKLKDQDELPTENGVWILDGVYWLDSFQLRRDAVFRGKGLIFVGDWNQDKPFTIGGSIVAQRASDGKRGDDHLTIVYYPFRNRRLSNGGSVREPAPADQCQMIIEGQGRLIEASVFSLAGIKTTVGKIEPDEYPGLKMDPAKTVNQWTSDGFRISNITPKVNSIFGNYVNYYMKKSKLNGDLWVFHDINNPNYFNVETKQLKEEYTEADELNVHTVHLSPRIQHITFTGATP